MMNRIARLRWWAKEIGKPNIVKPNAQYGISQRSQVSDSTKRRDLDVEKLALVKDEQVRMALRLPKAFELRREEAIKFRPSWGGPGLLVTNLSLREMRGNAETRWAWAGARRGAPEGPSDFVALAGAHRPKARSRASRGGA